MVSTRDFPIFLEPTNQLPSASLRSKVLPFPDWDERLLKRPKIKKKNNISTIALCALSIITFQFAKSEKALSTVWPEPIWIKVQSSWVLLPQHQSTCQRGPEFASISNSNLLSKSTFKCEHCETRFTEFLKILWSEVWNSGPLRYVLWCCCSICY